MSLFSFERHVEVVDRETLCFEAFVRPRVDHHRGVGAVEVPRVEQIDLAASSFFGWRPEDNDREIEFVCDCGEPNARAD